MGFLYILSNPSLPGLVKVGRTDRHPDERMYELFTTGVPEPFVVEYYAEVVDSFAAERMVHHALKDVRHSANREFFRIDVPKAIAAARISLTSTLSSERIFYKSLEQVAQEQRTAELERLRKDRAERAEQERAAAVTRIEASFAAQEEAFLGRGPSFRSLWLVAGAATFGTFLLLGIDLTDGALVFWAATSALPAWMARSWFVERRKSSVYYKNLSTQKDSALVSLDRPMQRGGKYSSQSAYNNENPQPSAAPISSPTPKPSKGEEVNRQKLPTQHELNCPVCGKRNRLPIGRRLLGSRCGSCKAQLAEAPQYGFATTEPEAVGFVRLLCPYCNELSRMARRELTSPVKCTSCEGAFLLH